MSDVRRMIRSGIARRMASFGFSPDQARDDHGRWTSGAVGRVVQALKEHGGGTVDPNTGKDVKEGYAVAVGTHSSITPTKEFFSNPEKIYKAWLKSAAQDGVFDNPNVKVGLWHDEEHDEIVLDPSEQVMDRSRALQLGRDRDQQGIYHLAPGGEGYIDTGGSGGRE